MVSESERHLDLVLSRSLVVLTGATSGLGLAMLRMLCERRVPVVAVGRNVIRVAQPGVTLAEADLAAASTADWIGRFSEAINDVLNVHPKRSLVLISNAGTIAPIGPAASLDDDRLVEAMQINFAAPLAMAKVVTDLASRGQRQLRIVNITTGAAVRPIAGWLAYCASKAACKMALDVLALENPSVELVHVDPGVVDTPMQAYIRDQAAVHTDLAPGRIFPLKSPDVAAREVLARALEPTR